MEHTARPGPGGDGRSAAAAHDRVDEEAVAADVLSGGGVDGRRLADEAVDAVLGVPPEGERVDSPFRFDRHLVLEQLGGWRGMVDATLPTVAFIVGNSIHGLSAGIWSAVVAAVLVFVLRLVRRQSVQQAVSGLSAVVVAVVIAAMSGHARDYFVLGILRNAAIGVVLIGSALIRRPLVGYIAEFLAPSHLGSMASHSLPLLRSRGVRQNAPAGEPGGGRGRPVDPAPERHWREDRRMRRSYSWLTVMWGLTFIARVVVQGPLYQANNVGLLGTTSLLLGLPVTAVALVVSLWVVARLHRHRCPEQPAAQETSLPAGPDAGGSHAS